VITGGLEPQKNIMSRHISCIAATATVVDTSIIKTHTYTYMRTQAHTHFVSILLLHSFSNVCILLLSVNVYGYQSVFLHSGDN
jgi:hypothetical protein